MREKRESFTAAFSAFVIADRAYLFFRFARAGEMGLGDVCFRSNGNGNSELFRVEEREVA